MTLQDPESSLASVNSSKVVDFYKKLVNTFADISTQTITGQTFPVSQVVDLLVQVIEALPPDGHKLLHEKLLDRTIQTTSGVCGGAARIRNTRIPVWTLVSFKQQGADELEILRNYPALTFTDLQAAWRYYNTHHQEIDRLITSHQEGE